MPPTIKVPVPAGKLGIALKGDQPYVSGIAPNSALRGVLKVGYKFLELALGDGAVMKGLDSRELIAALNQYEDDPDKTIKFSMSLPSESTVVLQSGAHGLTVEDKYGKATLTEIDYESALRKEIRVGMIVDSIELEDGSKYVGHSAEEFSNILDSSDNDSRRTLVLRSPDSQLSPRSVILPSQKEVGLPTGTCGEVGLHLSGEVATIAAVHEGSALYGKVSPGFVVHKLKLPGNHEFSGFNAAEMTECIDSTSDEYGRTIHLKSPDTYDPPEMATAKIMLPNDGTLDDMRIMVTGSPAKVEDIGANSPLKGLVNLGYTAYAVGWGNGTEYEGLSAFELDEVLRDSNGLRGRYIVFTSDDMKMPSSGQSSSYMPPGSMPSESEPGVVYVTLEPGKVGAGFKGNPPKLTRLSPDSPLNGLVAIGMVADTLTLADGTVMYDMETKEFTDTLKKCANDPFRKIRFIDPDRKLTNEPGVADNTIREESPDLMTVYLPTGKLSVKFKGTNCAIVSTVKDNSPLVGKLREGMAVDRAVINDRDYVELGGRELAELLMSTADIPGRSLKVRGSGGSTGGSSKMEGNFSKLPREVEVSLPTGKLGCTFAGRMPCAKSFKPNSPIASRMTPGMFVDKLKLPDGYVVSGFSSRELVGLLGQFANVEGRVLVLKSVKTEKQSPKSENFPMEKEIKLPTGKLGISFKGTSQSRVSRLHEESALLGNAYVGMNLDTIHIPGGEKFAGMSAKEAAKLLVETKNVEGRVMTLKSPDNKDMTPRNVNFDVSIGNSTAMSTEKSRRVG